MSLQTCDTSQVIVSCEALLLDRHFIYKEQAHTHKENEKKTWWQLSKAWWVIGTFDPNRSRQSTHRFPQSLIATRLGHQKKYLETYNHQRPSPFYFIKISPWWFPDSQILTVERNTYLQFHTKGKWKENSLGTKSFEGNDGQCGEGPKRQSFSNSCFKV